MELPWAKREVKNEDGARLSYEMKRRKFLGSYGGGALPPSVVNNNDGIVNNVSLAKQTLLGWPKLNRMCEQR